MLATVNCGGTAQPITYFAGGELTVQSGNVFAAKCFDDDVNATMINEKTLTTADRCDACGAQAYVRAVMPYGELLFCGHHANQHLEKLRAAAVRIQDERANIK